MEPNSLPLISVQDLKVYFQGDFETARAVDGVSFEVRPEEMVCLVGESGCGKTVTALSILGLISVPPGRIAGGKILFKGENLLDMVPVRLREAKACGNGTVDVLIPRFGDRWVGTVLGWLFKNKPIHLHLDEVGTSVWNLCDGRHTVHEIGKSLEEKFGDCIDPVYERLGLFFHQMKKAGIVDWQR